VIPAGLPVVKFGVQILPSYAEAKKLKSITLHTHGCPRASLRDRPSSLVRSIVSDFLSNRCSIAGVFVVESLKESHV